MRPHWEKVETVLGGLSALREAGETYFPRNEDEDSATYEMRKKNTRFTNVFEDILENLAQRPFAKEVKLPEEAPGEMLAFAEDVDARGSSLHDFAAQSFFSAMAFGIDWIWVDHTPVSANASLADAQRSGGRAYWRRYSALSVIAAYSAEINGQDQFTHVRLYEPVTIRNGFNEEVRERIRVVERPEVADGRYGDAVFQIWEKEKKSGDWTPLDEPRPLRSPNGAIPLFPVVMGTQPDVSWRGVKPPMRSACDLQIELFQMDSGLKLAEFMTVAPMLKAVGVEPELDGRGNPKPIKVGPMTVLYAPPADDNGNSGDWGYVEITAAGLKFVADQIDAKTKDMRELGRQPLTAMSGNLTRIAAQVAGSKGSAAIQAWAMHMKHALERALQVTGDWRGQVGYKASVIMSADFDLDLGDTDTFGHVLALNERNKISDASMLREARKRNILDESHDDDADAALILEELAAAEAAGLDETLEGAGNEA